MRDWPAFPRRGIVEGFSGVPWSKQTNLAMIDWLGQHKLNAFNYLPKDDPAVRSAWREPLSQANAQAVEQLVRRAASNNVDFTYGISPGDDICYSDPKDLAALSRKFAALWAAGVRSFELAFDAQSKRGRRAGRTWRLMEELTQHSARRRPSSSGESRANSRAKYPGNAATVRGSHGLRRHDE